MKENLRRQKLRKRTMNIGAWNVQGIFNKIDLVISSLAQQQVDIAFLSDIYIYLFIYLILLFRNNLRKIAIRIIELYFFIVSGKCIEASITMSLQLDHGYVNFIIQLRVKNIFG